MALVILDAKALLDDALEIDASPAHDAVEFPIGAYFDDRREFGLFVTHEHRPSFRRPTLCHALPIPPWPAALASAARTGCREPFWQGLFHSRCSLRDKGEVNLLKLLGSRK
jgi:hypothetical protein